MTIYSYNFGRLHIENGRVSFYNDDIKIDSSKKLEGTDLYSKWGSIQAKGFATEKLMLNSAVAYGNVSIENGAIKGHTVSQFRNVLATESILSSITAYFNINLINSYAQNLLSQFGEVSVKQTDYNVQSQFSSIKAYSNIDIINCSAKSLLSLSGHVVVRQTDGIQRPISNITACSQIVVQNSDVSENVTLHVSPNQQAILDLKNTKVLGKILIKVDLVIITASCFYADLFSRFFPRFFPRNEENSDGTKRFSLLIKADTVPKNIVFEGFEENEINLQKTVDGIVVTGRKR